MENDDAALSSAGKPAFIERWYLLWVEESWQVENTPCICQPRSKVLLDLTKMNQILQCDEHSSIAVTTSILQIKKTVAKDTESYAQSPIGNKRWCQDLILALLIQDTALSIIPNPLEMSHHLRKQKVFSTQIKYYRAVVRISEMGLFTFRFLMSFPNKYKQRTVKVKIRRNQKPHRRVMRVADVYPRNEG